MQEETKESLGVVSFQWNDVYSWEGENFSEFLGMKSEHGRDGCFFCCMSLVVVQIR